MDLLITGATGFVGSHLALLWLQRHPAARALCLVRAPDGAQARVRLHAALRLAANEPGTALDTLLSRAHAIPGDVDDPAWIDQARTQLRGPAELVHCAANLSFREADRPAIWRTNVEGTAALLRALPHLPGIAGFDYVSTAYVAGDRQGDILETERDRPAQFNNPYEDSKWVAEGMVRAGCTAARIPWRVLRPAIVIAHSVTHRMSSHSGFYHVIDALLQMARQKRMTEAGPIILPVTAGTTLDLIPIDVVADQVLHLIALGPATANQTFHVTAADPLPMADVLNALTPMSGVAITVDGADVPLSPVSALVMRRLRYYTPYFAFARRFDRTEAQAALGTPPYRLGLEELRAFVCSYLGQQPAPSFARAAE